MRLMARCGTGFSIGRTGLVDAGEGLGKRFPERSLKKVKIGRFGPMKALTT
jgi:hypothetical protein